MLSLLRAIIMFMSRMKTMKGLKMTCFMEGLKYTKFRLSIIAEYFILWLDVLQQEEKLNSLRQQYAGANQQGKEKMAPAILDLEKRVLQMSEELDALEVNVRNAEKTK